MLAFVQYPHRTIAVTSTASATALFPPPPPYPHGHYLSHSAFYIHFSPFSSSFILNSGRAFFRLVFPLSACPTPVPIQHALVPCSYARCVDTPPRVPPLNSSSSLPPLPALCALLTPPPPVLVVCCPHCRAFLLSPQFLIWFASMQRVDSSSRTLLICSRFWHHNRPLPTCRCASTCTAIPCPYHLRAYVPSQSSLYALPLAPTHHTLVTVLLVSLGSLSSIKFIALSQKYPSERTPVGQPMRVPPPLPRIRRVSLLRFRPPARLSCLPHSCVRTRSSYASAFRCRGEVRASPESWLHPHRRPVCLRALAFASHPGFRTHVE
jgi:hypothetical protein